MTIPEVPKALRAHVNRLRAWREATGAPWLLEEIRRLNLMIAELYRRRHAGPRRATSERMTPEKRMEIREYARAHPELTQTGDRAASQREPGPGFRDAARVPAMTPNPFDPRAYELDIMPTCAEAEILQQIHAGDRLVRSTSGKAFVWERGAARLYQGHVFRCLANQWVLPPCPDGPLFGDQHDGRLTVRGEHALIRYHNLTRS
jgi:hypothetical protein